MSRRHNSILGLKLAYVLGGLLSEPNSRPKNSEKNIFASKFRKGLNRRIGMNSKSLQTQDDYLNIVFY